jgi:hypothetical protein
MARVVSKVQDVPDKGGMIIEETPQISTVTLHTYLDESYRTVLGTDNAINMLFTMKRLIENPFNNPNNEKMRTINLANAKVKKEVGSKPANIRFFKELGWVAGDNETMVLKDSNFSPHNLSTALEVLEDYAGKLTALSSGLGKSHMTGTTGHTNNHLVQKAGGMADYNALVTSELQRRKAMVKPIKNRWVNFKKFDPRTLEKGSEELAYE